MDRHKKIMADILEHVLNYKLMAQHVRKENNPEILNNYVAIINHKVAGIFNLNIIF